MKYLVISDYADPEESDNVPDELSPADDVACFMKNDDGVWLAITRSHEGTGAARQRDIGRGQYLVDHPMKGWIATNDWPYSTDDPDDAEIGGCFSKFGGRYVRHWADRTIDDLATSDGN